MLLLALHSKEELSHKNLRSCFQLYLVYLDQQSLHLHQVHIHFPASYLIYYPPFDLFNPLLLLFLLHRNIAILPLISLESHYLFLFTL